MPHRLKHRQSIIQEKRKKTPWRNFLMEICSWASVMFYTNNGFSVYPVTNRSNVKELKYYTENRDSFLEFGLEYTEGNSFFSLFKKLYLEVGVSGTHPYGNNENSNYSDVSLGSNNAYLSHMVIHSSNVLYSYSIKNNCNNILSSLHIRNNCSNIYSCISVDNSFNIFYSKHIDNSTNIWFSRNLIGCNECIGCYSLENKQYHIQNKEYSKEGYNIIKRSLLKSKSKFESLFFKIPRHGNNVGSREVQGSRIVNSESINNSYFVKNISHGQNLFLVGGKDPCENLYDMISAAASQTTHAYGCMASGWAEHLYCCFISGIGVHLYYCYFCDTCSYCLGCIGLKNKSYCIFNKQYEKNDRYDKVDEIFAQMDADGDLGKFFPGSMNPFYFNDTAAYLIDPTFTKEEVTAAGYMRRDEPIKVDIPAGVQTVSVDDLYIYEGWMIDGKLTPNPSLGEGSLASPSERGTEGERHIDPEILKKVILDHEGNAYRVIPMELEFLVKHGLPLPRKHWLERMKENFRIG